MFLFSKYYYSAMSLLWTLGTNMQREKNKAATYFWTYTLVKLY